MPWGTLGASETLEGASGRSWPLRFERCLAPRENSKNTNPASSVWLVRDEKSARLFAAKRQTLASLAEVDALVDEAAAWRSACLADTHKHIVELIDVFVHRQPPYAVTFLAEFCARGLLPKLRLSEPVLLTVAADLARAAAAIPSPHAHISHESLLVDEAGRIRLAGFGAHRSAILRDNPGLTPADDAFDIGLLLFELMFGFPPPESLQLPQNSAYSPNLTDLVIMAFSHPHPSELFDRAVAAGAEPQAPVVDIAKPEEAPRPVAEHVARATERNVDRLIAGVDIAPSFAALLNDLKADSDSVASEIFSILFKKPVSKDPLCAMRAFAMLHNLMLDGPESMLAAIRKNDKFMGWAESSWTRESIETAQDPDDRHPAFVCFAGGELAFYAALLRRKAKFHMLAAGGFSGRWDRTRAVGSDERDVLTTRRRKVVSGMADVIEMASELGCRFAAATDQEAAVKHTSLGALVSECCLAYNAALEMTQEVNTARDAEKLEPGIERLYRASHALVFAVEHVPSAGGEDWVEQFAQAAPPDVVGDARRREKAALGQNESGEFPEEGWGTAEALVDEETEKKREKKEKKMKRKEAKEAKERMKREAAEAAKEKEELTVADGALVVHGADEAVEKVHTMFGDLLAISDPNANREEVTADDPRPEPNMSNTQALASAFGVPEESLSGPYAAVSHTEVLGDDGDDEGGYEDFRARQQYNEAERTRLREASNTAAWAARAGYSETALIVRDNAAKKSHPAFCQCAICQEEEVQAAAASLRGAGGRGGTRETTYNDEDPNTSNFRNDANGFGNRRTPAAPEGNRNSYYGEDYEDSLDSKDDNQYVPERKHEMRKSYYEDDYDSYESVTYSVEEDYPSERGRDQMRQDMPNYREPDREARHMFSSPANEGGFHIDRKKILNLKKLRPGDKISDTSAVSVSKGEYNRETVVVKRLTKSGIASSETLREFENEVRVMCTLEHPRVLSCIAAVLQKPNFIFATEYMKRGTIFDILHKNRIKLTWALIRKISLQIADGMSYIHGQGILHRDLKSLNIFVDGSYNIKIGDFGLSCTLDSPQGTGISGTYQYMAPEILKGEPHTFKSDVFSFAHVLCEMVSGSAPFQGMDPREVAERVVNEDIRPQIPRHCQKAYVNLIQMCWGTAPSTRPSFPEIVELINHTTK